MTKRLYYNDPALVEFEATIVDSGKVDGKYFTRLDKTAFYPTSGGQMHDTGLINEIAIENVIEKETEILHISSKKIGQVGEIVQGSINESRRFANRQQHTAQHIISQAFFGKFGLVTESVHLGESYGNIELNTDELTQQAVDVIEKISNTVVSQNRPVIIIETDTSELDKYPLRKKPTREGKIRLIHIDDFDFVACGGTHVTATGQIQLIKIIAIEKIRGRVAVKFLCGDQALNDYQQRFNVTSVLTKELTCGIDEILIRLTKLIDVNKTNKTELNRLNKELLPIKIEKLLKDKEVYNKVPTVFTTDTEYDDKLLSQLATLLADTSGGLSMVQSETKLVVAVSSNCTIAANEVGKVVSKKFNLKGGGNKVLAQFGGANIKDFSLIKESIIEYITHA